LSEVILIDCGCLVGIAAGCSVSAISWVSKMLHSLIFQIPFGSRLSSSPIENKLLLGSARISNDHRFHHRHSILHIWWPLSAYPGTSTARP
jgi:hypothetical protein